MLDNWDNCHPSKLRTQQLPYLSNGMLSLIVDGINSSFKKSEYKEASTSWSLIEQASLLDFELVLAEKQ